MPPAVAHAPIVIRNFESSPDSLNSLGVVWRGDRTFDQGHVVRPRSNAAGRLQEIGDLDAHPATASNWSSTPQQRKLATVARREFEHAQFRLDVHRYKSLDIHAGRDAIVAKDRSVLADERRPQLAMPTKPDGTLHVALDRDPDLLRRRYRAAAPSSR